MSPRCHPLFAVPVAPLLLGCVAQWPSPGSCEELEACGATGPASTGDGAAPTTGDGVHSVTGDDASGSTAGGTTAADESGAGSLGTTGGTTGEPIDPPLIVDRVIMPDYTAENALLEVTVLAQSADHVTMLDRGEVTPLDPQGSGVFTGQIAAYSGVDNSQYTAWFTPTRDDQVGEPKSFDYVIALPTPGEEVFWDASDLTGQVAAIGLLADGSPVEFGTFYEMGEPRCYLRLRDAAGHPVGLSPVLPPAHCTAIDLAVDRETGAMVVLLERKSGDDLLWWAGEISWWGLGPTNIGTGEVGQTAHAVARGAGVTAVCGSADTVDPADKLDALAVLLRPGLAPEVRLFDHRPQGDLHKFDETARDCKFNPDDMLVLVGEAWGKHEEADDIPPRDRLMVIEDDGVGDVVPTDILVLKHGPGTQSRALALDIDDLGRYHLAGYTCPDECVVEGDVRVYGPGGELLSQVSLGPLGSSLFGPHDIAWSPAGYAVVALGALQGDSNILRVQAFAPNVDTPLWTFFPKDQEGVQMALAAAIGPFGEVYAGGVAKSRPVFVRVGS